MGIFVRKSSSPSDKYGQIVYYIDDNDFIRRSSGPSDKYGQIVYYCDDNNDFIRKSSGPSDKYGQIVYYFDNDGFIRSSNGPSDKHGQIVYYFDNDGFIRSASGPSDKYGQIVYYLVSDDSSESPKQSYTPSTQSSGDGGMLLALALALGIIFAPVLIVLGMYGKFILKDFFENVLKIKEFKDFRKKYTKICWIWFACALVVVILGFTVLPILPIEHADEFATMPFSGMCIGNIALFILIIVKKNKIYKEHKDKIPQEDDTAAIESKNEQAEDDKVIYEVIDQSEDEITHDTLSEIAEEQNVSSNEANAQQASSMSESLAAIKQLKELLDIGAISKKEFEEKKNILLSSIEAPKSAQNSNDKSTKPINEKHKRLFRKILFALNAVSLTALIVGIAFLVFEGYIYNYKTSIYSSFIRIAFTGDSWCILSILFTSIVFISLLIQLYLDISKTANFKNSLISSIVAVPFNVVTMILCFILKNETKYNKGILLFAIFAAVCLLFVFARLVLLVVCRKINKSIFEARKGGKKALALIVSLILFLAVFGGATIDETKTVNKFLYSVGYDTTEGYYYVHINDYIGDSKEIIIPDTYKGYDIVSIQCALNNKIATSVVIPKGVAYIDSSAFYDCPRLTSITVEDSNNAYKSIDGNLYTSDGKTLVRYAPGKTDETFVIPDGVITIQSYAFYGCSSLTNITIPDSVTSIGDYAFSGCSSLTNITIPNSVTSIGDYAFEYCTLLTSIVIPNSVTSMGERMFYGCTSSLIIYCETNCDSYNWESDWYYNNGDYHHVVWGHTHSYTNGVCVCGKSEN